LFTKSIIKSSEYHDSVTLMEIARALTQALNVVDAAVVMATEANKRVLREAGLLLPQIESAKSNDLVVVVRAETEEDADDALALAEMRLRRRAQAREAGPGFRPRTIDGAVRSHPDTNLAVISVAGEYAAAEAWEALRNGLHVLLFSDNVSILDEVALKRYAADQGLLMMGPDCGTAIISGVALGFANVVPRGPVGIVAAAGTGLQEVSVLLARRDVGVSQGIGTGGRDLKEPVGGLTMLQGIRALQADPETQVLLLVSKPPAPVVARHVLEQVAAGDKPTVVCFLGGDPKPVVDAGGIPARTLWEAAYLAAEAVEGHAGPSADQAMERELADLKARASALRRRLKPEQRYLRALYSGGTLASEALVVWEDVLGAVRSNVALDPQLQLSAPAQSEGHCAVDLGDDAFTVGRPHPMLDNELRIECLKQEASDPEVAVILLDVVLGYGAHPDPASELAPAIHQARRQAAAEGRRLFVVTSVTGTEEDPQGLSRQERAMGDAGATVVSSNAAAAYLAAFIVARGRERT
jgi:FdrA protein